MNSNKKYKYNTLDKVPLNKRARISSLTASGSLRRRLLDFGFSVGNTVIPVLRSPFGDTSAYSVMGSVIGLRSITASQILVETEEFEK